MNVRFNPWAIMQVVSTSTPGGLLFLLLAVLGPAVSQDANEYPPKVFLQQPLAGSAEIAGNTKVLLCEANGNPVPVYRWRRNGEFITSNISESRLRLQQIQRSDAGSYQCLASNAHGALLSNAVHVLVAYMVPFAQAGNQDQTVEQGQARVIDLPPIDSYPAPSVRWYEGYGVALRQESQRYHVTLRDQLVVLEARLHTDSNKLYKATAVNGYTEDSSDSQTFVLKVLNVGSPDADIPPSIVIPPSATSAVQGDDVSVALECVANARPLNFLSLRWFRHRPNGSRQEIVADEVKYILTLYRRVLTIKDPVIDDSGPYECEASFQRPGQDALPPVSAVANLTVLVKPTFSAPPPSEINQDVLTTVVIPCKAVGSPPLNVRWYRNAVPVSDLQDPRISVLEDGQLHIGEAQPSDSGIFQCFVSNEAGPVNDASWVRILSSAPEILVAPTNQTVVAGDSVRFPCQVTGAPKPTVTWSRVTSGGALQVLTTSARIQVLDTELLIPSSEVSDSGRYICNASNAQGSATAQASLTVTLRTRIVAPPQAASVIKGSRTVLQCAVTADPSVKVQWIWFQDEVEIPSSDLRRQVGAEGSLEIKAIRNSDIGTYRCQVLSAGGNDTASADIRVIELPYPPVITSVALNAESDRAVDVAWSPGFDGNSPVKKFIVQFRLVPSDAELLPEDGWRVADSNVPPEIRVYVVKGLAPARAYQFRVSAQNSVGEGDSSLPSAVVQMPQQPPSGPPRGVVGSPRSESSILITWQAPDEADWNGPLLGYVLRYKPSGYPDSTLEQENVTGSFSVTHELRGLIVFQEYEIAVAAFNAKGTGVFSDYVRIRTQEGTPTAPPTDLQAMPLSSTAIRLTWLPPSSQFINGINQGYKVHALRGGSQEAPEVRTVPSNTSNMLGQQTTVLDWLLKFTEYRISVLCFTAQGDGPLSSGVSAVTLEDVPDAVADLRFDNILDTSLRVLWSPPPSTNGILTGYSLSYMRKNQTITKVTENLPPSALNFTIQGLTATTAYTIEVTARTRVGPGPSRSADISSGVPPVTPDPPSHLALSNIQARTVLLQFEPGFSGHTSIARWIVQAQSDPSSDWVQIHEVSAPLATSLTVQGLKPYSNYRLRLVAENVAGQSDPSQPTRWFETLQAPPDRPPTDVSVRALNETAVRVRWTPLAASEWNGEQCGYHVEYRVAPDGLWLTTLVSEPSANSVLLGSLEEWTEYHVQVSSFNRVGASDPSRPPASEATREATPTAGPSNVTAAAVNSTCIHVTWGNVPEHHQNGLLLGFKVRYSSVQEQIPASEIKIDSSSMHEAYLTGLRKYVWYDIQVLAFTRIGDGEASDPPFSVRTDEDTPGPPSAVYFPDVTNTAVRIVWEPPRQPNGLIRGYRVAYGLRAEPPAPQAYTMVDDTLDSGRRSYEVTGLQRNTYYVFAVTAETRLGWGVPAELEVYTIISRRVPDAPSPPLFGPSQVGDRWVELSWTPGADGYGPVRNFTLQVQRQGSAFVSLEEPVPASLLQHNVTGLTPNSRYKFRVAASNDLGLGPFSLPSGEATTKQAAPDSPPLDLKVIPMTTTSVLVSWQSPPEETWNGHLMGYNVEYREVDAGQDWRSETLFNAALRSVTIHALQLFRTYEFRIRAFNALGQSAWSPQTTLFLEIDDGWNGRPVRYEISFRAVDPQEGRGQASSSPAFIRVDYPAAQAEVGQLTAGALYEVRIRASSSAGPGPLSRPYDVFLGEAVPLAAPQNVRAETRSATEIQVSWDPPPSDAQNGEMLGYKIFFWPSGHRDSAELLAVAPSDRTAILNGLQMFTEYASVVLAFNAAGDGPNSTVPVVARTSEGVPSAPGRLHFLLADLDAVNVSWSAPLQPNGLIELYEVSYYMDSLVDGESLSVQVKLAGDRHSYVARELTPSVEYVFSVRAKTSRAWGPSVRGNVTVRPLLGSPDKPTKPRVTPEGSALRVVWEDGASGAAPISAHIVQAREGSGPWATSLMKAGPQPDAALSFLNFKAKTLYQFRVMAYNDLYGVGVPSEPSEVVRTPDAAQEPFYKQWWFLVIAALTGLILILVVVSLLCLTGRRNSRKAYKAGSRCPTSVAYLPHPHSCRSSGLYPSLPRATVQLSENGAVVHDEEGFATFELRRSQRGTLRSVRPKAPPAAIASASSMVDFPVYSNPPRIPPRPSPGSINYNSDEDTKYPPGEDDDESSLSEKPSDLSSSMADSDEEDVKGEFRHTYVNGDVQQSWQRQQHQNAPYAYPESQLDGHYGVSLNGGHVIMNNVAGSRAPLPGYSSFV